MNMDGSAATVALNEIDVIERANGFPWLDKGFTQASADRVVETIVLLYRRGPMTRAAIAKHFKIQPAEVSRSILRPGKSCGWFEQQKQAKSVRCGDGQIRSRNVLAFWSLTGEPPNAVRAPITDAIF